MSDGVTTPEVSHQFLSALIVWAKERFGSVWMMGYGSEQNYWCQSARIES